MSNIRKAYYTKSENPAFQDNPLIEALPPKKTEAEFFTYLIKNGALLREEILQYSPEIRSELLGPFRLTFFTPQKRIYELYKSIYSTLTSGYFLRNPRNYNITKDLRSRYDMTSTRRITDSTSSLSSSLIGTSGIGKSTGIIKIISHFPEAISHEPDDLNGITQVPIVKVECPKDSSIIDLCRSFFIELDDVLGTNYVLIFGKERTTADSMVNSMAKLVISHYVGMLVIDEIEQLTNVKNKSKTSLMLNFFVNLNNKLKIPILIVGTPESISLFSGSHRLPRRWSGQGSHRWQQLSNDEDWEYFIEMLFSYQYTNGYVEYSKDWSDRFYYYCQGISDNAVRLFVKLQEEAFNNGWDTIREESVSNTINTHFREEIPAINALRSGKLKELSQFPDLYFADDLEHQNSTKPISNLKIKECHDSLQELGVPKEYYISRVSEFNSKFPNHTAPKITLDIYKEYKNSQITEVTDSQNEPASTYLKSYSDNDLRKFNPDSSEFYSDLINSNLLLDITSEGIIPIHGT